ncbi:MAG: glycosyltransferase family 4 protein, partial [Actinomadura rubrobrunea]|nr:glycosyltransferase family 4 protein [Actinomadura rubrobrunea]
MALWSVRPLVFRRPPSGPPPPASPASPSEGPSGTAAADPGPARRRRRRVLILLQHAHGTGGTVRTVLNLAGHLARRHHVEIVSVVRRRAEPFFPVSPDVTVRFAEDRRVPPPGRIARLLARLPSVLVPADDASFRTVSLWTDVCLLRALRGPAPDVLIGTRPSLNLLVAELGGRGTVAIGQDHMNLSSYRPGLRREIARAYRRLTAVTVLTEASRDDYRAALAGAPTRVVRIPNALPDLPGGPSPRTDRVILAAGRLTRQKGFDLLLRAYAPLAAEHPDWTLRIFGAGPKRDALRQTVADHGLADRERLCGRTRDLAGEMTRASVYVLPSRFEGMPMVLLEAMSKGLAVVAFDCPTGPGEMITHGRDGLVVPAEDVPALTAALRRVIEDAALRDRLGEGAAATARRYALDRVGAEWERLLDDLSAVRRPVRVDGV